MSSACTKCMAVENGSRLPAPVVLQPGRAATVQKTIDCWGLIVQNGSGRHQDPLRMQHPAGDVCLDVTSSADSETKMLAHLLKWAGCQKIHLLYRNIRRQRRSTSINTSIGIRKLTDLCSALAECRLGANFESLI